MPFLKKKKFWFNVHLILSLACIVPLLIVALSGAVISYHDEIIDHANSQKTFVERGEKELSAGEILDIFKAKEPNFTLSYYKINSDANHALGVSGTNAKGEFKSYFINQYTGEITGENFGDKFIGLMLNLHTNLGLGLSENETLRLIGKHIVAVSSIALVVLVISGLIIYYPSFKTKFIRAFTLKIKAKGYAFLYSLHGFAGVYLCLFLAFISVTGLYWSYDWAAKLVNNALGEKEIFRKKSFTQVRGFSLEDEGKIANLEAAIDIFKRDRGDYELFNIITQEDGENFMIFYFDKGLEEDDKVNTMTINAAKGQIIRHARFDDAKSSMPRPFAIHKAVLSLHSGYFLGEVGKFIFCLASASVLFFVISGFWMSLKPLKR